MAADDPRTPVLVRCGCILEHPALAWNAAGIVALAIAAITPRSVALADFGQGSSRSAASAVSIWELSGTGEEQQRRGLRDLLCLTGNPPGHDRQMACLLVVCSAAPVRPVSGRHNPAPRLGPSRPWRARTGSA